MPGIKWQKIAETQIAIVKSARAKIALAAQQVNKNSYLQGFLPAVKSRSDMGGFFK